MFPTDSTRAWRSLGSRLGALCDVPAEGRAPALEGIRGLAIVLVFFVHYHTLFGDYAQSDAISHFTSQFLGTVGHCGVDLFFVLSGFLIYGLVLRKRTPYLKFIQRRVERIYPTFAAVFGLYLVLSFLSPNENKIPSLPAAAFGYLLANAALLPGLFNIRPIITVAWSLSYEFAFYAVVPLIVSGLSLATWSSSARVKFLAVICAGFIIVFIGRSAPLLRMSMFIAGMLVYEALGSHRFRSSLSSNVERFAIVLLLVAFPVAYVLLRRGAADDSGPLSWNVPVVAILFITFFAFVSCVVGFDGTLRRFFSLPLLRRAGNISYSFYLIHGVSLKALSTAMHTYAPAHPHHPILLFWMMLPLAFGCSVVAAIGLFHAVERPLSLSPHERRSEVRAHGLRDSTADRRAGRTLTAVP